MTGEEFERRGRLLEQDPDRDPDAARCRIELLEGIVCMSPGPDLDYHGVPSSTLSLIVGQYRIATPGVVSSGEAEIEIDPETRLTPDHLLFITPECGGQMRRDADGRTRGIPELCIEVANTSVLRDVTQKRDVYERAGVQEYLVYATRERQMLLWHRGESGRFESVRLINGQLASAVFPGLVFDVESIVHGEDADAVAALKTGPDDRAHRAFVEQLATAGEADGKSN